MPNTIPLSSAWKTLLREHAEQGVPPEAFFSGGGQPQPDEGILAALAALPEVRERSFRRGAVLCAAGAECFTALLFWRERILGVYRHTTGARGVDGIAHDLKEFRLGWLPDETVRQTGGDGSAFAILPPEAEGFPLICLAGPGSALFAEYGKLYTTGNGAVAE